MLRPRTIVLLLGLTAAAAGWYLHRDLNSCEINSLPRAKSRREMIFNATADINTTRAEVDESAGMIMAVNATMLTDIDSSPLPPERVKALMRKKGETLSRIAKQAVYKAETAARDMLVNALEPIVRQALRENETLGALSDEAMDEEVEKRLSSVNAKSVTVMSFVRKDAVAVVLVGCPMNGPRSLASILGRRIVYVRTTRIIHDWISDFLSRL